MAADKIDAVKKVSQALNTAENASIDKLQATAEHFQSLVKDAANTLYPNFEIIDSAKEGLQDKMQNPIFAEENVSTQKQGSATDQEKKRDQNQQAIEEVEESKQTDAKQANDAHASSFETHTSSSQPIADFADLQREARKTVQQIGSLRDQLRKTPEVEIKSSHRNLLVHHLNHVDDNIKIAMTKAGMEYIPAPPTTENNPLKNFLELLTHSQSQLSHMDETIDQLKTTNRTINPVDMLAIQVKLGYIQQQLELFANLLNKALESVKTIMNVQV